MYQEVSDKINNSAQRILENLETLNEITKNRSYEIPAESELEEIRRSFDSLQLDSKERNLKELEKWAKSRKNEFEIADDNTLRSIEGHYRSFADLLGESLRSMFSEMNAYDNRLKSALANVNLLSNKLQEVCENVQQKDMRKFHIPSLELTSNLSNNSKYANNAYESASNEAALRDELMQSKEREEQLLSIVKSLQMVVKEVKMDIENARQRENNLNQILEEKTEELKKKLESIQELEHNLAIYQMKEELREKSKRNQAITKQIQIYDQKTDLQMMRQFLNNPNNLLHISNSFSFYSSICEYVPLSKNGGKSFNFSIGNDESMKKRLSKLFGKDLEEMNEQEFLNNIQKIMKENEELKKKLGFNGQIKEPSNGINTNPRFSGKGFNSRYQIGNKVEFHKMLNEDITEGNSVFSMKHRSLENFDDNNDFDYQRNERNRPQTTNFGSRGLFDNRKGREMVNGNSSDSILMEPKSFEAEDIQEFLYRENSEYGNLTMQLRPMSSQIGFLNQPLVRYSHYPDMLRGESKNMFSFADQFENSGKIKLKRSLYSPIFRERMAKIAAMRKGYNPRAVKIKYSIVSASYSTPKKRPRLLKFSKLPPLKHNPRIMGTLNPNKEIRLAVLPKIRPLQ